MFKVGDIVSVPVYGVMKAIVTKETDDYYVYYRIIKDKNARNEGEKDSVRERHVRKGEASAFELMVHGKLDEEIYAEYIAEQRNIWKRIKRKWNAIKRRVRD